MEILNLIQGSPEWKAARLQHFCASEAPAMMGLSKYQTRSDLLKMKATGITPDVDTGTQALFDRGHAAEAMARPIAEEIIGEELYPCTGRADVEGLPLLASFDGLTMDEDFVFEHKLYAQWLADHLRNTGDLPDSHWPQVEHQMIVSGAWRTLFMCSTGSEENWAWIWYDSHSNRRAAVLAGWKQFAADLAAYVPAPEVAAPAAVPVENLPSLVISVTGSSSLAVTDNLTKFGAALKGFIDRTPKKPETDDEFAICESAIKTLTKAEEALDAAESAALAQVSCIDEMRMLKGTLRDLARSNRLALEKLVKAEKENRKNAIVLKAQQDLCSFVATLPCADFFPVQPAGDFGGAIKGLKTMASIQNAVDTELARVKIEATAQSEKIAANMATIDAHPEHAALFADRRQLALKDAEFVELTVKQRIADHQAAEAAKIERIRAEEQAKAQREADAKIEAARLAEQPVQIAAPAVPAATPIAQASKTSAPTLSLGAISSRLGFTVSREFLSSIGFEGKKDRAAFLYHEADFGPICAAIARHVVAVAAQEGKVAA